MRKKHFRIMIVDKIGAPFRGDANTGMAGGMLVAGPDDSCSPRPARSKVFATPIAGGRCRHPRPCSYRRLLG